MTQSRHIKKALDLSRENPDAEIHICAASDEIVDDHIWTAHKIGRVELGWWYELHETIYTDPQELAEALGVLADGHGDPDPDITAKQAREKMARAILIYTHAG